MLAQSVDGIEKEKEREWEREREPVRRIPDAIPGF